MATAVGGASAKGRGWTSAGWITHGPSLSASLMTSFGALAIKSMGNEHVESHQKTTQPGGFTAGASSLESVSESYYNSADGDRVVPYIPRCGHSRRVWCKALLVFRHLMESMQRIEVCMVPDAARRCKKGMRAERHGT